MLNSMPDDEEIRYLSEDGYTAVFHIGRERAKLDGLLVRIDGVLVPVADLAKPVDYEKR